MKFGICIPNYNYEDYLGLTFDSILAQTNPDFEVVVADNKSTDGSVALINEYAEKDKRIKFKVNPINLGFAGNLDAVVQMVRAERTIMLSSDDIILPASLSIYDQLLAKLVHPEQTILSSAWDVIDSQGKTIDYTGPNPKMWMQEDIDAELSAIVGTNVYRVSNQELLRRCLHHNLNPFHFATMCYPTDFYQKTGGYTASKMMNPDKWFNWRILPLAREAIFVDKALFQYRWHERNQTAQQANTGHLKYVTDEYRSTIDLSNDMLTLAGIERETYYGTFVQTVILNHGLAELSRGMWLKSYRINRFGWAAYPGIMLKKWRRSFIYSILLLLGPIGIALARLAKRRYSN